MHHRSKHQLAALLALTVTSLLAGPRAWADDGDPPEEPAGIRRSGFVIGLALGGGTTTSSCMEECAGSGGAAVDLHLGAMVSSRLALMFDGSGVGQSTAGGDTFVHVVDTLA